MAQTFPRIDTVFLTQFLASVLGSAQDLVSYRLLRQAEDYAVVAAILAQPQREMIIKFAGPRAVLRPAFERSAAIAQLVREHSGARTFEVVAVDGSCSRWPWQYLVTTYLPGEQWSDFQARQSGAKQRALFAALGTTVGQLHSIRFPTCGEIAPSGNVTGGTSYYTALQERARRRIARPAHVELFLSVLQEHRVLFEELLTGVLCHEDLNPFNLLVQELATGEPSLAVIDFDSAWAGCAESDLARLEFWRGMIGDGFWEAYRRLAPLSDAYPLRRPIYQLLWCLEYARPTVQHFRDTARVCEELHLPPVAFS
jgi:aminoglycoside phosphotransferase (APT) family kinase protein